MRATKPWLTWDVAGVDKTIYLSFDDGPDPEVSPRVLDILKEYNAKATFFLTGSKASHEKKLAGRIISEGHVLGNHTFGHLNGFKTSTKRYLDDVDACAVHVESSLFRPPFGRITPSQIFKVKNKGYRIVMWSVMSNDFNSGIKMEDCLKNILKYTRSGSVVVFHDTPKAAQNCLYVLPRLLRHFSELGFAFETLDLPLLSEEIM